MKLAKESSALSADKLNQLKEGFREMDFIETQFFIALNQKIDENVLENFFAEFQKEVDGGWVLEAIEKRFRAHEIEVDKKIILMIGFFGKGAVGICAKHVDFIAELAKSIGLKTISWHDFIYKIYPHGVKDF